MNPTPKIRHIIFTKWIGIVLLGLVMFPLDEVQGQGCECVGCSGPIPASASNLTFTLNVSGSTNNDLSNNGQGVCGVYLDFQHDFAFSLEILLTAPSGQTVTLIGPASLGNPVFVSTLAASWDIGFLPCNQSVMPDISFGGVPFAAQWYNLQGWEWFTEYDGTYHPNTGCLDNLTGSVDGPWTITINNIHPSISGTLNGFSIEFCDDSGLGCDDCVPDAGSLLFIPDFDVCAGESTSSVNFEPLHQNGPPSSDYSYTYIVSSNGVIQEFNELSDLSTLTVGTYEVCGLSYLTADLGQIPSPNGSMTVADLNNQLVNNGIFCGEITDDCFSITILSPPSTIFLTEEICDDEVYMVGGESFNTTGTFFPTLEAASGCDTLV